jgi:hypothetical protein
MTEAFFCSDGLRRIVIASTHQGSSPKQMGMTFLCYFELD